MIQQINLYQDILKQKSGSPASSYYLYGTAMFLIIMIGFSMYLYWNLDSTQDNLKKAKEQLLAAETHVGVMKINYPQQQLNPLLNQEITRLQSILDSLNKVIQLLNDKQSDKTQGFSRYLLALSRQNISDVWLSNISINADNQNLKLVGSTYNAERIPVFIQRLQYEPAFQGKNFAKLFITEDLETANQINFSVNTSSEEREQDNHD